MSQTEITTQDWNDYSYIEQLVATNQDDFRFIITPLEEVDDPCETHRVEVFDWKTGEELESFFTNDPFGYVEAARERQETPNLEDRLAMYAERGW